MAYWVKLRTPSDVSDQIRRKADSRENFSLHSTHLQNYIAHISYRYTVGESFRADHICLFSGFCVESFDFTLYRKTIAGRYVFSNPSAKFFQLTPLKLNFLDEITDWKTLFREIILFGTNISPFEIHWTWFWLSIYSL